MKLPQALAYIPPEDVVDGFQLIKSKVSDPTILEFYTYIEDNYVGKTEVIKTGRGRGVKH